MVTKTGMIPRQSIEGIVAAYDGACGKMRLAFQSLHEAAGLLRSIAPDRAAGLSLFPKGELRDYCFTSDDRRGHEREAAECLEHMRRRAWGMVVRLADIEKLMSLSDRAKLRKQLEDGTDLPALTVENVEAFISRTKNDLPNIMDRAIVEVFEALRPRHHEHYKTNQKNAFKVGRRVIHEWSVDAGWRGGRLSLRYGAEEFYQSLDTAFCLLDGKLPPSYPGNALTAIREALARGDRAGECAYWKWRAFANGNMHLEFTRPDLLDRMNVIGGRGQMDLPQAS